MKTFAIVGYARHGKDTVAEAIQKLVRPKSVRIYHLADPIKEMAASFGWDGNKDKKGRTFLQQLGTEIGRAYNDNHWVDIMERDRRRCRSIPLDYYLIPDVRFENEVKSLTKGHCIIIVVKRPVHGFWKKIKQLFTRRHSSERYEKWIKKYPHHVVINDGTIAGLEKKIEKILKE